MPHHPARLRHHFHCILAANAPDTARSQQCSVYTYIDTLTMEPKHTQNQTAISFFVSKVDPESGDFLDPSQTLLNLESANALRIIEQK
jgi:hypothetical protein